MSAVCQVCGEGFEDKRKIVGCLNCETLHHEECWDYTGKCSLMACGSRNCVEHISKDAVLSLPNTNLEKIEKDIKSDIINNSILTITTIICNLATTVYSWFNFSNLKKLVLYPFLAFLPEFISKNYIDKESGWFKYSNRCACLIEIVMLCLLMKFLAIFGIFQVNHYEMRYSTYVYPIGGVISFFFVPFLSVNVSLFLLGGFKPLSVTVFYKIMSCNPISLYLKEQYDKVVQSRIEQQKLHKELCAL